MTGTAKKKTKRDPKNWKGRGTPYFSLHDPREDEEHRRELQRLNPNLKIARIKVAGSTSPQTHATRPSNMAPNMNPYQNMQETEEEEVLRELMAIDADLNYELESQDQYSQYSSHPPQQSSQQTQHAGYPPVVPVAPFRLLPSARKFKENGTPEVTPVLSSYPSPAQSFQSSLNQLTQSFQPQSNQNGWFYQSPSSPHAQFFQPQPSPHARSFQPLSNHQSPSNPGPQPTPEYFQHSYSPQTMGMEPPQYASQQVMKQETLRCDGTQTPAQKPSQKPALAIITERAQAASPSSSIKTEETSLSMKSRLVSTLHPEATKSWYENVDPVSCEPRLIRVWPREVLQKGFNLTDHEFDIVEERIIDLLYQDDLYKCSLPEHKTFIEHHNTIHQVTSELKSLLGKHGIPGWWKDLAMKGWLKKCVASMRSAGNKLQDSIQRRKMRILQAEKTGHNQGGSETGKRKAAEIARDSVKKVLVDQYSDGDDEYIEEPEDGDDVEKEKRKPRSARGKSGGRATKAKKILDHFASEDEALTEPSDVPPLAKKQKATPATKAKKAINRKVAKKSNIKVDRKKPGPKPLASKITTQPPPGRVLNRHCHFHITQRDGNLSEMISLSDILKRQSLASTDPGIDFDLEQLDLQRLKENLVHSGMMKEGVDKLIYAVNMGDSLQDSLIARPEALVRAAYYLKIPGNSTWRDGVGMLMKLEIIGGNCENSSGQQMQMMQMPSPCHDNQPQTPQPQLLMPNTQSSPEVCTDVGGYPKSPDLSKLNS